jgi:hypothetical protein
MLVRYVCVTQDVIQRGTGVRAVRVQYRLSEIPKSENLQNPKLLARQHEHNGVQV